MTAYFFDSSAIVKRYVSEAGTSWVIGIADPAAGGRIYIAAITGVEVIAAVTRRLKGKSLTATDAAAALSSFRTDFAKEYRVTAVGDSVIARAMAAAEAHALRGYDAVQLAAAVEANAQRLALGATPLILVSADKELLAAGAAEGLPTEDPNTH